MTAAQVRIGLFFLIFFNLIDIASTLLFIYIGGEELNVLMSFFLLHGGVGRFIIAKFVLVFFYVVTMLWYTQRENAKPGLVKFAIIVPNVVYALTMVTHFITWIVVLKNA